MITNVKLKFSVSIIGIGFLPTLCYSHTITNQFYLVHGILHHIWTQQLTVTNLKPSYRGSTFSTIQCFIRSHLYAALVAVVICKLQHRQMLIPATFKL